MKRLGSLWSSGRLEEMLAETSCRVSKTGYVAIGKEDYAIYGKLLAQFGFTLHRSSDQYGAEYSADLGKFLKEKTPIRATALKAILRHRPDRIVVGEVRGREARTLLDALNTGHRGMLATIHATTADGALQRLATLATREALHEQRSVVETEIRVGIHDVVHLVRDGYKRRVEKILS
jgi:hypothetical protein